MSDGDTDVPRTRPALSALELLQQEPARFDLDTAAATLAPGADPVDITYRTVARLAAPAGEVARAQRDPPQITTSTFGLIGVGGVLPRHYTAIIDAQAGRRSTALHQFVDLLASRLTGMFVKAGIKHRPTREPRRAQAVLAAAVGLEAEHLVTRLESPLAAVLYHAGGLSNRTRSIERLRSLLCEEIGAEVEIVEFCGGWVRVPVTEQSRLPGRSTMGRHVQLGRDAALGQQLWDPAARFVIRLGPLGREAFERLLPGSPLYRRVVELTRLHVGLEQEFAFNPLLEAPCVPPLRLGAASTGSAPDGGQLGWTSWLSTRLPRAAHAADALFGARSEPPAPAPV